MDKREIELAKQNIFKDRRRRLLYLNKEKTEGHHISDNDMRLFSTLKNGDLIALLIFLVIFGIFGQNLILALGFLVGISLVATLILNLVFLPKRNMIKLNETDLKRLQSHDFLKALEAGELSKIIIFVVLSLMILLRFMDTNKPLTGLEFEVARFSVIFFITYAATKLPGYLRLRKARKQASQQ